MRFSKIVRLYVVFLFGVGSIFLSRKLDAWLGALPGTLAFLAGSGVFLLAGAIGCALFPRAPFSAASVVVVGVFFGISLDVTIFPTINGYERNLYPLEIAAITIWAALCCFALAAVWRVGYRFLVPEKSGA